MRIILSTLLLILTTTLLSAQGFSGGFKAGLNFSTFEGELEGNGDVTLESFKRTTGFHVGATFAYAVTDLFGFKADLMYSQKGTERVYEGPSFLYIYTDNGQDLVRGDRRGNQDFINSYIDIPVMVYYKIGPIELAAGPSIGFMINSAGSGGVRYTNTPYGPDVEIPVSYEANYFRDETGAGSINTFSETPIPGTNVFLPNSVGAYYNSPTDENLFRRFDFGAVAGISFYLNNGLYIGGRYSLGLTDVTRVENDLAAQLDENGDRQFRDDNDRNRSIQVSLGFRF